MEFSLFSSFYLKSIKVEHDEIQIPIVKYD